ncbi:hypothetical protein CDL12_27563 [Handroanthus impetiginosus]|uniref:Uncharacterized protein n=1 Tax=Handroanthus impetiginosus TaxID=429701 RepID=A0A2G9G469_9LAMI|nr:hypothetical protein CDL12_27563 [Handroanthus impetiginosus]
MAQEEQIFGCRYSGGGGGGDGGGENAFGGGGSGCSGGGGGSSRSKKIKQKKVPQSGLGVAQLEKIRLEEQQRKEIEAANILANSAISDSSQFLAVLNPKFGGNLGPFQNSVHLQPPTNNPSSNGLYRNAPLAPNLEIRHENPMSKGGGGEMRSKEISNGNWPRLWNGDHNLGSDKQRLGDHNLGSEKQRLDHHGFAFESHVNLPYRSHQFQWPSCSSSSMVNSSSYAGISPSSVLSSQMEPPSNQSFHGNYFTPSRLEEDKMVGMKRPYPFYLELPPARSSNSNFLSKPDELAASNNGCAAYIEPRNKCIREGPSNSSSPPKRNPNEVTKDDGKLNGDFLTLAPPSVASSSLNSKLKYPLDYSSDQGPKFSGQEYAKGQIHQPGPSGSAERCISFFPIKSQIDQTTASESDGNGDKEESIDLDLKL